MKHKVEIKRRKATQVSGKNWQVDSATCHIIADGIFVGYCTPKADPGTVNITVDCPDEIVNEVKHQVGLFWESVVRDVSTLAPIENEPEDEEVDE